MASAADVLLAKRLLAAGVLGEAQMREAFELIERVKADRGQTVGLDRVLYHLGMVPKGSLAAALAPSPLVTQPFPGYRLDSVLGEGGTSTVYGGIYLENGAPAAVKVLDPVHALRPGWLERFRHEARLLIDVEHENIVLGYEVGEVAGLHYVSMERLLGDTVEATIDRRGFLHNDEALSIVLQMARALGALHDAGWLHRDVKPSNVMVEASGRAVLIDLGFTGRVATASTGDEEGEETTLGTVQYLSPEQARGRRDLDPRSDIYSLGVSLYHMVVGEVPFQGDQVEVLAKQVLSDPDAQKTKKRRIAPEVQFFIAKMMSKDRTHRYETMAEVVRELSGYLPGPHRPIDLALPPPVCEPLPMKPPSQKALPPQPLAGKPLAARPLAGKPSAARPSPTKPLSPKPPSPTSGLPPKPPAAQPLPGSAAPEGKAARGEAPVSGRKRRSGPGGPQRRSS